MEVVIGTGPFLTMLLADPHIIVNSPIEIMINRHLREARFLHDGIIIVEPQYRVGIWTHVESFHVIAAHLLGDDGDKVQILSHFIGTEPVRLRNAQSQRSG